MAKKKAQSGSKKKARTVTGGKRAKEDSALDRLLLQREVAHIVERERLRLSREMHDGLSQQIAGIAILAATLANYLKAETSPHAERAAKLAVAAEDAKIQARDLVKRLTRVDVDASGLCSALEELAGRIQATYDMPCTLVCPNPVKIDDNFVATHLYRIASEAVHNALKHATPSRISIELTGNGTILLIVRDDGNGFDCDRVSEGEGLRIMRYRAGLIGADLSIGCGAASGTVVCCKVNH